MMLASGLLLIFEMLKIWLPRLGSILLCGLKLAGNSIPLGGLQVAGAGMYLPAPGLAVQGAIWGEAEEKC